MDAVLGCIMKYKPQDIKPWVNSLNRCGFTGKKIMVVYELPQETAEYLIKEGFEVYQTRQEYHLFLQRFRDYHLILSDRTDIDRVIHTDVKDVIFQSNPSEWMDKYKIKPLLACSEAIVMGDDDWAQKCAGTSFPMEWEMWLKKEESYCAGTILGDREYAKDLFLNIFRWALTGANPQEAADQPAYNCLIKQKQYKDCIQFVKQEEGLAVQLGTTLIKKDFFGNRLLEPTPIIKGDFTITNQKGDPFCIVHQYDRNPQIKDNIIRKYS